MMNTLGNIMYTSCSICLIIDSIILLLDMVEAIVMTIKQKDWPSGHYTAISLLATFFRRDVPL